MGSTQRSSVALAGILALIQILSAGCGRPKSHKKPPAITGPYATVLPPATSYFLADPSCQSAPSPSPLHLVEGTVYRLTSDFQLAPERSESLGDMNITSQLGLTSPAVSRTTFGGVFERVCPNPARSNTCESNGHYIRWHAAKPAGLLRICEARSDFGRESYEGIALTNIVYLERVIGSFRNQGVRVPPLALEILPEYRSIYTNETDQATGERINIIYFLTHNLGYFKDEQKIAVWPEPAKYEASFKEKGHLWESPFGIGHEAGHHLEQQIAAGSNLQALGGSWNAYGHRYEHFFEAGLSPREAERLGKALNSLSEGFADLAAFYALDEDENAVTSMYCIGLNRNPHDPLFYYRNHGALSKQEAKQIDSVALSMLFGASLPSLCDVPNLSDIHTVGAVVAYVMDDIFDRILEAERTTLAKSERSARKLAMTIDWFNATTAAYRNRKWEDPEAKDVFQPLATGIEVSARKAAARWHFTPEAEAKIRASVCRAAKQTLSVLDPLPFADAC